MKPKESLYVFINHLNRIALSRFICIQKHNTPIHSKVIFLTSVQRYNRMKDISITIIIRPYNSNNMIVNFSSNKLLRLCPRCFPVLKYCKYVYKSIDYWNKLYRKQYIMVLLGVTLVQSHKIIIMNDDDVNLNKS